MRACYLCGREAVWTDSVPDASRQGVNLNECGYRVVALCAAHGAERRQVATARLEPIDSTEVRQ